MCVLESNYLSLVTGSSLTHVPSLLCPIHLLHFDRCLCLGNLTRDNPKNQAELFKASIHLRLVARLHDDSPDVRAAACYAINCLIGAAPPRDEASEDINLPTSDSTSGSTLLPGMAPSSGQQVPGLGPSFLPSSVTGMPLQTDPSSNASGLNLSWQVPQHQTQQGLHLQGMQPLPQLNQTETQPSTSLGPGLLPTPNLILSVYQDQKRLDSDLLCAKHLSSAANEDGSPTVRHEAVLSLANFVAKYIEAFVAIADEGLAGGGASKIPPSMGLPLRDNQLATIPDEGDEEVDDEDSTGSEWRTIPLPEGVNASQAEKFSELLRCFYSLQRKEPYEYVSLVLSNIVSGVNENMFALRMKLAEEEMKQQQQQQQQQDDNEQRNPIAFNAPTSDPATSEHDSSLERGTPPNVPTDFTPVAPPTLALRRHQTEDSQISSTASKSTANVTSTRNVRSATPVRWSDDFKAQYRPPASKFYDWKRAEFGKQLTNQEMTASPLLDPLSHEGAVQIYRERRNLTLHKESENLSESFACLAPKPQQKRRTLNGGTDWDLLNAGLNDAASKATAAFEGVVARKKQALHLGQTGMLMNKDKKMTSMLKFHAYEPALVVSDGGNAVSLWDINTSKRINSFRNGSSKIRNTSMTWINEMSSSLLMMGTGDGTIRIYDGLIEDSGGISRSAPELATAFVAAPDLDVGKRGGSGLVTEWQQFSGRLLAGGSSKTIHCWDLEAERCRATFESNLGSCVTTMTTAWDYTSSDLQSTSEGYSGIGPDIFIAGYGNGALKVYDIRANGPVSDVVGSLGSTTDRRSSGNSTTRRSRRPPKLMQYAEHSSWVVNTAFTGFGGRYEICSGSVAGDIRFFDLRIPESIRTLDVQRSPMTALACHPGIPFFATGSHAQFIKIMSMDGDTLQVIRYHEEIAGQRMGPVSCLAFHPHRPLLAAGATDEIISLYAPK